jgi:hypothetical protein
MATIEKERETTKALPAPTRDLEQGLANIREYGFTIVPDALTDELLVRTSDALYR